MSNEKSYTMTFKQSQLRELQLALMYHIDIVLIPLLEEKSKVQDYIPTMDIRKRIIVLQGILEDINRQIGPYKERE